jgi:hypothetical protein
MTFYIACLIHIDPATYEPDELIDLNTHPHTRQFLDMVEAPCTDAALEYFLATCDSWIMCTPADIEEWKNQPTIMSNKSTTR